MVGGRSMSEPLKPAGPPEILLTAAQTCNVAQFLPKDLQVEPTDPGTLRRRTREVFIHEQAEAWRLKVNRPLETYVPRRVIQYVLGARTKPLVHFQPPPATNPIACLSSEGVIICRDGTLGSLQTLQLETKATLPASMSEGMRPTPIYGLHKDEKSTSGILVARGASTLAVTRFDGDHTLDVLKCVVVNNEDSPLSVASAAVNPYDQSEFVALMETGTARVYNINESDVNEAPFEPENRLQSGEHIAYGSHPRTLLVADHSKLDLWDLRFQSAQPLVRPSDGDPHSRTTALLRATALGDYIWMTVSESLMSVYDLRSTRCPVFDVGFSLAVEPTSLASLSNNLASSETTVVTATRGSSQVYLSSISKNEPPKEMRLDTPKHWDTSEAFSIAPLRGNIATFSCPVDGPTLAGLEIVPSSTSSRTATVVQSSSNGTVLRQRWSKDASGSYEYPDAVNVHLRDIHKCGNSGVYLPPLPPQLLEGGPYTKWFEDEAASRFEAVSQRITPHQGITKTRSRRPRITIETPSRFQEDWAFGAQRASQ